ncbi:protein kinase [Dehalococcoidia bacterium]|nr:protein kinase [Dehalococcoidia bacterium]
MKSEKRISDYQLLEEVSSGGHATVYRVRDRRSGRVLALKVLHPHLSRNPAYLERFQREAQLASSLAHPNIVRIFEVGENQGSHFIAMEYVPLSLNHLLREQQRLPIQRAVDIAHQVSLGLAAAGEQNIVHRDVKPQNVLLRHDGSAKLTDFGIARAEDLSSMTRTGTVMGTPQYLPPEQARGEQPDIRSDIYSLGIMLYQMLTGTLPFQGGNPWDVIRRHIQEDPAPIMEKDPDLPVELAAIVDRCLRKNPADRFQTPLDLAKDLERLQTPLTRPKGSEAPLTGGESANDDSETTLPFPSKQQRWRQVLRDRRARSLLAFGSIAIILLIVLPTTGLLNLFGTDNKPATAIVATPAPIPEREATVTTKPTTEPINVTPSPQANATIGPTPAMLPTLGPSTLSKPLGIIEAGIPLSIELTREEAEVFGITDFEISLNQTASEAILEFQLLSSQPTDSAPPGSIYAYLDIALTNVEESTIKRAAFTFSVPTKWLIESAVRPETVTFYRYDGRWSPLPTTMVTSDSSAITYHAEISAFSLFAIAGSNILPPLIATATPPATPPTPPTMAPTSTPTPPPTVEVIPDETVYVYKGVANGNTESFRVNSRPWKLQYQTSWSGNFTLRLNSDGNTETITGEGVSAGVLYETFIYDLTGQLTLTAAQVPPSGDWTIWVISNPTMPESVSAAPPKTTFVFTGNGQVTSGPFSILASPWKLLYTTSWSGAFSLGIHGDSGKRTVSGDRVTAGIMYETFIYNWSGPTHFVSSNVPPTGRWTVWVIENPMIPSVSPTVRDTGVEFTFTGTGEVASPPFPATTQPWKLLYTTSWAGPFHLQAVGGGQVVPILRDGTAGVIRETFVYGVTGSVHLAAIDAPPDGAWSVSVLQVSGDDTDLPEESAQGTVLIYTGVGQTNSPPFSMEKAPWRLRYQTSWSGDLVIRVAGKGDTEFLVETVVSSGIENEVLVSGIVGETHIEVLSAPLGSNWTIWIMQDD